jgi:hypothetical protein
MHIHKTIAAICLASALVTTGFAQPFGPLPEPSPDDQGAGGALSSVRDITRMLTPIRFGEEGIAIDRQAYDRLWADMDEDELTDYLTEQFIADPTAGLYSDQDEWKRAMRDKARRYATGKRPRARAVFEILRRRVPHKSAGSGSSGRRGWHADMGGRKLDAAMEYGPDAVSIRFEEKLPPHRRISVIDRGDDGARVLIERPADDLILMLIRPADGGVRLVEMHGDKTWAFNHGSPITFYREHREYVEQHLLPLLDDCGLGVPANPAARTFGRRWCSCSAPMPTRSSTRWSSCSMTSRSPRASGRTGGCVAGSATSPNGSALRWIAMICRSRCASDSSR